MCRGSLLIPLVRAIPSLTRDSTCLLHSLYLLYLISKFQVASTFAQAFEALLDAYQDIGECIPLLAQYESHVRESPHMHSILGLIYSDILEFHQKAMQYFKKNSKRND